MWLSGYTHSYLIYTLTSAPSHMVYKEAEKIAYNLHPLPAYHGKSFDEMLEIGEDIANKQLVFDSIPENKRVKIFKIERDDSVIEAIRLRVEGAREIYEKYYKSLNQNV